MPSDKATWQKFCCDSETLIRRGQLGAVGSGLKRLSPIEIPADFRSSIANIARRCGLLRLGLNLLRDSVVKPANHLAVSPKDLAEYVILLVQSGCVQEGARLLDKVNWRANPELLMAKVFCQFECWQHSESIPLLEKYIDVQRDWYLRSLAMVNLADANLREGHYRPALESLNGIVKGLEDRSCERLLGHCFNLRAKAYYELKEYNNSDCELGRAVSFFGDENVIDSLLIRMQKAVNQSARTKSTVPLLRFRSEALNASAWECVRETDRQILRLKPNRALFQKLYFGTPYFSYRKNLLLYPDFLQSSKTMVWGNSRAERLNLTTGNLNSGRALHFTSQNLRLLNILLRDLYRPQTVAGVFDLLFQDEHYHPIHSPTRIHQCMKRLRQWLKAESLPLNVICHDGGFLLCKVGDIGIEIDQPSSSMERDPTFVQLLALTFPPGTSFTAREACAKLGIAKATMTRYLATAVSQGGITRRNLSYSVAKLPKNSV